MSDHDGVSDGALPRDPVAGPQSGPTLFRSEREFRRLLEKLPAGAYTCDPEGLITYFNQHAAELWGRAPRLNDPVDRFCGSFKLFSIDGAPLAHDECWMALALKDDREYNGHEILIERPDGRRLTALAHANPIRDESGRLLGAVNVLVDISARKTAEDALKRADRSKNEFLATLAHELRNPLAPIRNAVQILQLKSESSPEARWAVEIIDRQTQLMTRLVDDLIDLARLTSNKLELQRWRIELSDVLRAALETSRPLIDARGHAISVSLPRQAIPFDGDLTRLVQVFSNLLNNAAKYTPLGGHISLRAERRGERAVISVADTGVGISPGVLPGIFEMFAQGDPSAERPREGLGIGLTLARRLVEMHGGSIRAHSDGPGKGSEFVVELPLPAAPPETIGAAAEDVTQAAPALSLRILVVDDNEDSAESLAAFLKMIGNDVRVAYDGPEALQLAGEFEPDVILLDIGLPRMSGYEAARRIRQEPWGRTVLLIAVTGWGQDADKERSRLAGFDHHLVKPLDLDDLLPLLGRVRPARGAGPTERRLA